MNPFWLLRKLWKERALLLLLFSSVDGTPIGGRTGGGSRGGGLVGGGLGGHAPIGHPSNGGGTRGGGTSGGGTRGGGTRGGGSKAHPVDERVDPNDGKTGSGRAKSKLGEVARGEKETKSEKETIDNEAKRPKLQQQPGHDGVKDVEMIDAEISDVNVRDPSNNDAYQVG